MQAKLSPTDSQAVVNCILPIAELENQTLELIVTTMQRCHVTVERTYGIMSRIVRLDPDLDAVKNSLTPLATAVSALKSCEDIIKLLVQMKVDEVKHLKPYLETPDATVTIEDLKSMVDHAHSIELLLKTLEHHLTVAKSISETLQALAIESAGAASLAYWRGMFVYCPFHTISSHF